jgi:23S rRNA pseudouridine2604 synthase
MSRPTLKLPAQTATDDDRSRSRKPLRGGAGKSSSAQRAVHKAQAPTMRSAPDATPTAAAARQPAPQPADNRSRPAPQAERDSAPVKKVYPKRGIARSTGARALPPPRIDHEPAAANATAAAQKTHIPAHTEARAELRRPLKEPPRLAKRIAAMTGCSRRQADEWIENGWVSVDGAVVTTLGSRVHPNARVEIKDEASQHRSEAVTIVLNKPAGADGEAKAGTGNPLLQLIRSESRWVEDDSPQTFKATHLRGLTQAGKLDAEAGGMVVLTQEGSVARRITGDETRLEKEYLVRVDGELSPEGLALLGHGLELDAVKLKRAQVSWQNEQQLRFVLHEERKQQIARMCEQVGLRVLAVKRLRIGSVSLGKLPAGQWRYLRNDERF